MHTVTDEDIGTLFDRHARAVYNHAFRLTGSWSLAEEIVQATFLTAWRRRAAIRLIDGSPLPWLLVTAGNQARAEQRRLTRWRRRLLHSPAVETEVDPADDVAGRLDDERRIRDLLDRSGTAAAAAHYVRAGSGRALPDPAGRGRALCRSAKRPGQTHAERWPAGRGHG